ncbi:SDR family oxidoreductase [Pseudorhodoferax sp. Leaf274]|uniref:SDR family oxidoreductase n=1 Tax=Pseudorhodoferax sp. Leaf274 TaxID=1736318 RepID=UPI0007026547|nr:SDR family oxidoreductase [Pseudorhodoferax sp. Leaf274]KQP37503.1 short-chain dehydrogenase [Pseudorhodoferax sp. Leaf274]
MYRTDLLQGQRILVTGGGSGLGAEMAARFAGLGAALLLCGRRLEMLEATAQRLRAESGASVTVLACDIRQPESVEAMLDTAWRDGPVDALVNNAAATFIAQTHRMSTRAIDAILATTLHGTLYCTHGMGRRWIDAGRGGSVLSILSTSVRTGRAFTVPSAIAKSGVLAMTRSLAAEWGGRGIRLVAIEPGPFPTAGATRQLLPQARAAGRTAALRNPLGRTGQPEELANLAAYLLSAQAAYINGESIAIDGGAHLRTSGAEDLCEWSDADWDAHRAQRS